MWISHDIPHAHFPQLDFGGTPRRGQQIGLPVLIETGCRTTEIITALFPSTEACDRMIASGIEHGANSNYDRLQDVLVESLT